MRDETEEEETKKTRDMRGETKRHRDKETQRHRDTERHRDRDTQQHSNTATHTHTYLSLDASDSCTNGPRQASTVVIISVNR